MLDVELSPAGGHGSTRALPLCLPTACHWRKVISCGWFNCKQGALNHSESRPVVPCRPAFALSCSQSRNLWCHLCIYLRASAVGSRGRLFVLSVPGIFPCSSRRRWIPTPHLQEKCFVFVADGESVFLKISLTSTVLKCLPRPHVGMKNTIVWPSSLTRFSGGVWFRNVHAETHPCLSGEKYLHGEGNCSMDQKNNGTVSHSAAVNTNAKHATLSRVCLYTQGKIPIECICSLGFSGCI